MIAYLHSSFVVRAYLADEPGHAEARDMLLNPDMGLITGTWTRIEVSGAIVRAARNGRANGPGLLSLLDEDLGVYGPVTVVHAPQNDVEDVALKIVRDHGIRAMDAWHLASASIVLPELTASDEDMGFASRDTEQAAVAAKLGLTPF